MIDWFEVVNIKEEPNKGTAQADVLYNSVLHIYLDERDTRSGEEMDLKPNGFSPPLSRTIRYATARCSFMSDADVILMQTTGMSSSISTRSPPTVLRCPLNSGFFLKDSDGQASIDSSVISKILSY